MPSIRAKPETWTDTLSEYFNGLIAPVVLALSWVYVVGMIGYLPLRLLVRDRISALAFVNAFAPYLFIPALAILVAALLLRWSRLAVLAGLLALAGVLWFAPYFMPPAIAAAGSPTLRVVSFNVGRNNEQYDEIASGILAADADVVALQEVTRAFQNASAWADLRAAYPYWRGTYVPSGGHGNAILSRYPILTSTTLDIPQGLLPRWLQRAEIEVDGWPVVVYNAHFSNPLADDPGRLKQALPALMLDLTLHYNPHARDSQLWQLLEYVETETLPVIAAGDLGLSDQSTMYTEMASRLTDSLRAAAVGFRGTWPVGVGILPRLRVDYVWHTAALHSIEAGVIGSTYGSDHLPVYAVVAPAA